MTRSARRIYYYVVVLSREKCRNLLRSAPPVGGCLNPNWESHKGLHYSLSDLVHVLLHRHSKHQPLCRSPFSSPTVYRNPQWHLALALALRVRHLAESQTKPAFWPREAKQELLGYRLKLSLNEWRNEQWWLGEEGPTRVTYVFPLRWLTLVGIRFTRCWTRWTNQRL